MALLFDGNNDDSPVNYCPLPLVSEKTILTGARTHLDALGCDVTQASANAAA